MKILPYCAEASTACGIETKKVADAGRGHLIGGNCAEASTACGIETATIKFLAFKTGRQKLRRGQYCLRY